MTTVPTPFAAALTLAAGLFALPAAAAALDPFAGLEPMDAAELGSHRGGMMVNGIPMDFAVVIRTTVEGAVAQGLQTLLTVNDRGGLGSAITTPIGDTSNATVTTTPSGGVNLNLPTTTIMHEVIAGQIQTLIANSKSNVSLNHTTEVNIGLPGFDAVSRTWYGNSRAAQMGIDAAFTGLGHR
ncbi:MAG: hypothetical protein NVV74_21875 [Magnetospirillum sp.]|nr:hypothetical protein [Magnetospirillum sp.]